MEVLLEMEGIRYTRLHEQDFDEVAHLVANVFTDGSEPITRALGVGPETFAPFVRHLCPKFEREGTSVVARAVESGEVVAAHLSDDMGTEFPQPGDEYGWIAPALAILEELDRRYWGEETVQPAQYVHLFLAAVLPEYRRKQISSRLLDLSLALAVRLGYKKAVAEATGLFSQHQLRKAGFKTRVEIPYGEFEFEGNRPFERIRDHPSAQLMDRDLVRWTPIEPRNG